MWSMLRKIMQDGQLGVVKRYTVADYLHTPVYSKLFKYSFTCCDPIIVGVKEEPSLFLMIQLFEHNINQSLVLVSKLIILCLVVLVSIISSFTVSLLGEKERFSWHANYFSQQRIYESKEWCIECCTSIHSAVVFTYTWPT